MDVVLVALENTGGSGAVIVKLTVALASPAGMPSTWASTFPEPAVVATNVAVAVPPD